MATGKEYNTNKPSTFAYMFICPLPDSSLQDKIPKKTDGRTAIYVLIIFSFNVTSKKGSGLVNHAVYSHVLPNQVMIKS